MQARGPVSTTVALGLSEDLATSTWNWLGDARRLGLGLSEYMISDLAMLEIARNRTSGVGVRRVSKQTERTVGFDWLWIGAGHGRLPTIYVVRAKKLKLDQSLSYSYGRLRYPAGSKYQMNALQDFAEWLGAVPMYCFYNNRDHYTALMHWHCRLQSPPDITQLGCTLVPLDVVRPIHDGGDRKGSAPSTPAGGLYPGDVCFTLPAEVPAQHGLFDNLFLDWLPCSSAGPGRNL